MDILESVNRPRVAFYGELSDANLWNLSEKLTQKENLRKLAILGLRIEASTMQKHLANNPNDISAAAFSLLTEWRNTQDNKRIAFTNLCDALERSEMRVFTNELG